MTRIVIAAAAAVVGYRTLELAQAGDPFVALIAVTVACGVVWGVRT